jgi:hypothetical protein
MTSEMNFAHWETRERAQIGIYHKHVYKNGTSNYYTRGSAHQKFIRKFKFIEQEVKLVLNYVELWFLSNASTIVPLLVFYMITFRQLQHLLSIF